MALSWCLRMTWSASSETASSPGTGVVQAYWCCIGVRSGTKAPAIRPMRGPHIPAQLRTYSVSMRPREVSTARTRPSLDLYAGHLGLAVELRAPRARASRAIASATLTPLAMPVGGDVEAALGSPVGSRSGLFSTHSSGREQVRLDAPGGRDPLLPLAGPSSRSGVAATSMLPTA